MIAARTLALMSVVALFLALACGAGQGKNDGANQHVPEQQDVPEQVVRDLLDSSGRVFTTDDRLARIAREHEGGFGGYYLDETDRNKGYVFMLDPGNQAAAETAFREAYRGKREITQVVPVQGQYKYTFDQLVEWFYALDAALVREDMHPGTGAVLEITNRIEFGLRDLGQVEGARKIMQNLGIPQGAVIFVEANPELLGNVD